MPSRRPIGGQIDGTVAESARDKISHSGVPLQAEEALDGRPPFIHDLSHDKLETSTQSRQQKEIEVLHTS